MQPTYLPWAGYFNLISQVESFIFLDDVQFERRSWQTRNRIYSNNKEVILSISTVKSPRDTLFRDIKILKHLDWKSKHLNQLRETYKKAPFFSDLHKILFHLENNHFESLSDFNIFVIKLIAEMLELQTKFIKASQLECGGKRSEHLGNICRQLNCLQYLSPLGSKEYLNEDRFEESFPEIDLLFQNYVVRKYDQINTVEFAGSLSIVDVIANIGIQETRDYIL